MEYIPNQFVNASHTIAASKKIDLIVGSEDPKIRRPGAYMKPIKMQS